MSTSCASPLAGLSTHLVELRACAASPARFGDLQQVIERIAGAVERVVVEYAGMAEEVLSAYEQLGVVFEVCRRLPTVQTETAVVELFVQNLRSSFKGRDVFATRQLVRGGWSYPRASAETRWVSELLDAAVKGHCVCVREAAEPPEAGGPVEALVGPVFAGGQFVCAIVLTRTSSQPPFQARDMSLLEALTTFCGDLIANLRLGSELRQLSVSMVRSLVSAVDQKDEYTSGHSIRVGYFATLLGRRLGLSGRALQMLQWGALLHDVGKIGIRDEVLKKTGRLTEAEFGHMKEHPERSHRVVAGVPQLRDALDGVLHHHEHFDGSGYPHGLSGEQIPLSARVIQVADIFDALTSNRAYRKAFSWTKALDILKEESGRTVDPRVQQTFDDLIRRLLAGDEDRWERLLEEAGRFTMSNGAEDFIGEGL